MNLVKHLKDHQLVILPNKIKQQVLTKLANENRHLALKFMDFTTLQKHLFFDYDWQAVGYLMDKYHLKVEVCKVYLDNMYYIEDKKYNSDKLNQLLQLKKELEAHDLLQKDPYFQYFLANKEVIVIGYAPLDRFQKKMVEILSKESNVTIEEFELTEDKPIDVYEFQTMEEEVDFVACSILDLVQKGISLNKIKLANVTEEYHNTIKRVFAYYHLPIILEQSAIYSTIYSKEFLCKLKETQSIEESFTWITDQYPNELELEQKLLDICNQVNLLTCSFQTKFAIVEYLLKNTSLSIQTLQENIETISFDDYELEDDEYLFLLGVNQNIFPKLYKDEEYISDRLKEETFLSSTKEKNQLSRMRAIQKINQAKHIILTYKLKSPFDNFYPSSILEEIPTKVQKEVAYHKYRYSHLSNKMNLAKLLDRYRKFQEKGKDLTLLNDNYPSLPYLSYQNQFTGIDQTKYLDYIHHKLLLSYTSMNQYHQCGFRYYLNYVLKLDPFEETFKTFIGNLYHRLLSLAFLANFNFDQTFDDYQKTRELTVSETFFLQKLRRELKKTIAIIKEQQELTNFRQELYEKEITVPIQSDIKVLFKGTVDKIMYQKRFEKTYVSVIDYKTGSASSSLTQMMYGLNMQLPIYLYLVKHSHLFSDISFVGFYLQKILHNEVFKKEGLSLEDQKKQDMKLVGYSLSQEDLLEQFDMTYQNSELIKGMKITSKGFSRYAKVVTEEEIESILRLTEKKIQETVQSIIGANFQIDPKKIGKENVSCPYCPFADICYHKEEDIVLLEEYQDLSFLTTGGEENG